MNGFRKYKFTLETLSTVILSPREQSEFYLLQPLGTQDSGYKVDEKMDGSAVKIIYPFYQYGVYDQYNPEKAEYYIPGSSIKGAIVTGKENSFGQKAIMVDDIKLHCSDLQLGNLYKVQHIPKFDNEIKAETARKSMRIEPFFPKVAVEMLQAGKMFKGELFGGEDLRDLLKYAHEETIKKWNQLGERIKSINETCSYIGGGDKTEKVYNATLNEVKDNLKNLRTARRGENSFFLVLGGHKGLLLSGLFQETDLGGIYVDMNMNLPHGLIEIRLEA